jgi:hypothetical protein
MRLRYWMRLIEMKDERIPKIVYQESKRRMEEEGEEELDTWCRYTKDLLQELGLGEYWVSEKLGPAEEWFSLIRNRIHEREEKQWQEEMKQKTKLRTYRKIKHRLEREAYLETRNKRGITELVRLRGGTNRLRIEKGRYEKLPVEDRVCLFCESRAPEDEEHFMLHCPCYAELREEMWKEIDAIFNLQRREEWTNTELMNVLLGDRLQKREEKWMKEVVMKYVCRAMKRRGDLEKVSGLGN